MITRLLNSSLSSAVKWFLLSRRRHPALQFSEVSLKGQQRRMFLAAGPNKSFGSFILFYFIFFLPALSLLSCYSNGVLDWFLPSPVAPVGELHSLIHRATLILAPAFEILYSHRLTEVLETVISINFFQVVQ